jgi:hypothetical protein
MTLGSPSSSIASALTDHKLSPLQVNDQCHVLARTEWDGEVQPYLPAVVLGRRISKNRKRKAETRSMDKAHAGEFEYYIHYIDYDRCVSVRTEETTMVGYEIRDVSFISVSCNNTL